MSLDRESMPHICLFFIFYFYSKQCFHMGFGLSMGLVHRVLVYQWVPCTTHGTHYLFDKPNKWWAVHTSGSRALFTGLTNLFFQQLFHYK